MLKQNTYLAIVRASAIYDIIATLPFMTPWTLSQLLGVLAGLHLYLGASGEIPQQTIFLTLFANLLGSVVVIWAFVRLRLGLPVLGRYDAAARLLFSVWQIYAVYSGASVVVLAFTAIELLFFVLQMLPFRRDATQKPIAAV